MTANLQIYLSMAELPNHFTMHFFRVGGSLSKSLAVTAEDGIMKIGDWKTSKLRTITSGLPLVDKCRAARKSVARVTRTLASHDCRHGPKIILQRVQERAESMLEKVD